MLHILSPHIIFLYCDKKSYQSKHIWRQLCLLLISITSFCGKPVKSVTGYETKLWWQFEKCLSHPQITQIKIFSDLYIVWANRSRVSSLKQIYVAFLCLLLGRHRTHLTWQMQSVSLWFLFIWAIVGHPHEKEMLEEKSWKLNCCKADLAGLALLCVLPSPHKTTSLDSSLLKSYSSAFTTRVWNNGVFMIQKMEGALMMMWRQK